MATTTGSNLPKTTVKNCQIKVAKIKQTAAPEMGIEEKTMYYLLIITDKGQVRLNVGEKTYTTVEEITK